MTVNVDNYTRFMLTVIAVLLSVVATGLWFETPDTVSPAYGRIVDSGLQLNVLIEETTKVNDSIRDIAKLLRSGDVKVTIVSGSDTIKTEPVIDVPKKPEK